MRVDKSEFNANLGKQRALESAPWTRPVPVRQRKPSRPVLLQFDRSPVVQVIRSLRGK